MVVADDEETPPDSKLPLNSKWAETFDSSSEDESLNHDFEGFKLDNM